MSSIKKFCFSKKFGRCEVMLNHEPETKGTPFLNLNLKTRTRTWVSLIFKANFFVSLSFFIDNKGINHHLHLFFKNVSPKKEAYKMMVRIFLGDERKF